MGEKRVFGRMIQKHDTEENWLKAVNFKPEKGEFIVYDIDENFDYERVKVGDGVHFVKELPFISAGDEQLAEALEDALQAAKDSGEFDGEDGVGIQSIEQTTTSNADGGDNVLTVTKTDGTKSTFTVKNGIKGDPGESGVHLDKTEPTDPSVNVWIDPDGEPSGYEEWEFTLADGSTVTKRVVLV